MKIAVLGTGRVGTGLVDSLVSAGHDVTVGSRHPESHSDSSAVVTSLGRAIDEGDVIINATPGVSAVETLVAFATELAGKVLFDVANAVSHDGEFVFPNSSLGEHLQRSLPDTRVVKSLNTVNVSVMTAPGVLERRTTVFLSATTPTPSERLEHSHFIGVGWSRDSIWAE